MLNYKLFLHQFLKLFSLRNGRGQLKKQDISIMEITRKNFKEHLPRITKAIEEASFLSIDGEFTGLTTGDDKVHGFDSPKEQYQKLREGGLKFILVQFGLSAFKLDKSNKRYVNDTFNFYVFPKPMSRNAPDLRFLCQTSSIDFLASHGFDFNKLFYEGIPYLSGPEELALIDATEEKYAATKSDAPIKSPSIQVPTEYTGYIDTVCKQIDSFLEDSGRDVLSLLPSNGFQRKLLYQLSESEKYSTRNILLQTKSNEKGERYIQVLKANDERKVSIEKENKAKALEEVTDAVGFTKIIRLISESGKLVVGHNMLLDLLHVVHQFCHPLDSVPYEDFKTIATGVFPRIIDTKLMATNKPFKDKLLNTSLDALHKQMQMDPFVKANVVTGGEKGDGYSTETRHEAGYDAFITGECFITMANFLGRHFCEPAVDILPLTSELLQPYVNKIFLLRMQDVNYMDLVGQDPPADRSHVFHVTFPKEWRATELHQLFDLFGSIMISWISDSSAFVSLNDREKAKIVLKTIPPVSSNYRITPFDEMVFQEDRDPGRATTAPPPAPHAADVTAAVKRSCVSDLSSHPVSCGFQAGTNSMQGEPKQKKPKPTELFQVPETWE